MSASVRLNLSVIETVILIAIVIPFFSSCGIGPPSIKKAFEGRPQPIMESMQLEDGRTLSMAQTGNPHGRLVLFIHGSPGVWNDFAYVMADPDLAGEALLISVERPGWGGSGEGNLELSLRAQADALRQLLEVHRENLPAIVVGHSYGGPVAARLAMDDPELVGQLILVAGSIDPDLEETTWYQSVSRWMLVRWMIPDFFLRADEEIKPLKGSLERMLPLWNTIRMPVVVLQGEDDGLVPPGNADFAERVLTKAPLSVERIPDQGHLIPWERPDLIIGVIRQGLQKQATSHRASAYFVDR